MRWTVFCRVVDNFGDIGFAWRLAADLGTRGEDVRLAVDDASALAWMAPQGAPRVEVVTWQAGLVAAADVRVETFGCGLPEPSPSNPVAHRIDVNVEHLSAETYVERSHRRPSPRYDADGRPRPLWFFYPGFSERTGGLILEPGLLEQRECFGDGRDWLHRLGVERREGERCVSLFCYRNAALAEWLDILGDAPTLLLLSPGAAAEQAEVLLGPSLKHRQLRAQRITLLSQGGFDRLLWSCDLNFVRGEDSLVRAIWAGTPFIWQLYPQSDGVHVAKLDAFLARMLDGAPAPLGGLRRLFSSWNDLGATTDLRSDFASLDVAAWASQCRRFRNQCASLPDLTSALLDFVALKR